MKRCCFVVGIIFLATAQSFASWAIVQQKICSGTFPGSPFTAVTFDTAPADTHLLILSIHIRFGGSAGSITSVSSSNATWVRVANSQPGTGLNFSTELWYGIVSGAGGAGITVAASSVTEYNCNASEYSGNATSSVLDGSVVTTTGTTNAPATGTYTSTSNDDLIFALVGVNTGGSGSHSVPASFTELTFAPGSSGSSQADYRSTTGTGTYSASWGTWSFVSQWTAHIVGFKAAGVGGGPTPPHSLTTLGVGIAQMTPDNIVPLLGITSAIASSLPPVNPDGTANADRQKFALDASIDSLFKYSLMVKDPEDGADLALKASKDFAENFLTVANKYDVLGFNSPLVDYAQMVLKADTTSGVTDWSAVERDLGTLADFGYMQGWIRPGSAKLNQLKAFMLDFTHIVDAYNRFPFPLVQPSRPARGVVNATSSYRP